MVKYEHNDYCSDYGDQIPDNHGHIVVFGCSIRDFGDILIECPISLCPFSLSLDYRLEFPYVESFQDVKSETEWHEYTRNNYISKA